MTETNSEKQSPTYKQYAKHIGKLFWELSNNWDHVTGNYKKDWRMVMVTGLARRWGRGHYIYNLSAIGVSEDDWRSEYRCEAARFTLQLSRNNYVPVDKDNLSPPQ